MKDRKTQEAKQEPQPVNWPQWMRSGLCALLITSAQPAFGSLNAQNVITMSFRNATVEQVLDRIEQDTDYTFLYSDQMVDRNRKVSIQVESQSLEETLQLLFAGTNIRYRIVDHQVILSGANSSVAQQTKQVKGVIQDASGSPLIGANVIVKGTTIGTITDFDGKFTLDAPANATLVVTYIGYVTQEVRVDGRNVMNIVLKEDSEALDEVVVIGYGSARKGDLTGPISSIKGASLTERST